MTFNLFGRQREVGEILKAERMLVRIELIDDVNAKIPKEYTENTRIETRLKRAWREYYVVARAGANESKHIILHIHKNRRIPGRAHSISSGRSTWQIHLNPDYTRVSLFSPLDKTIAVLQQNAQKGYILFIFNCQSLQSSTQWFALLRHALEESPPEKTVLVTVPDLENVQIKVNTFKRGETAVDDQGRALINGTPISANEVVKLCMAELRKQSRWADVLDYWEKNYEMGLCWKRYDRIEWITGGLKSENDELAASWSLQHSHSLELRPKIHYPTNLRLGFEKRFVEPVPIEGFLIRLTSANGKQQKFRRIFYHRLYFSTHDNLLFFSSPSKAAPPPPPIFHEVPDTTKPDENPDDMPVIWASTPYKLKDGKIQWLEEAKSSREVQWYDGKAIIEHARCVQLVKYANGFIDLTSVKYVRTVKRKPETQDRGIGQGESVDFHAAELSTNDPEYAFEQGTASEFDDERAFELVLENGLVIRLQAFDLETRREWMHRLRDLIRYWKLRLQEDLNSLKEMRAENLKMVKIDRGNESRFADWIPKYQLVEAVTAPGMYHFCRLGNCRPISMRGSLYAKFRRRQSFEQFMAVLTSRTMVIYEHTARSRSGIAKPRIHHKKLRSIDLRHCYIYSGLMVDSELVYQTTNLDPHLGYRVLPKVFWDGWTSVDDDLSCAFVVWHGKRKFTFRSQVQQIGSTESEKHSIANVGLPGDILVFMARSRFERDLWVMALAQEINRHASTVGEQLHIY